MSGSIPLLDDFAPSPTDPRDDDDPTDEEAQRFLKRPLRWQKGSWSHSGGASASLSRTLLLGLLVFAVLTFGFGVGVGSRGLQRVQSGAGQYLDPDKVAVIIEKRNLPTLLTTLSSFMARTPPEWPFKIYYGRDNEFTLRNSHVLKQQIASGKLTLVQLPKEDDIYDGRSLSKYLTQPGFWEELAPAKHIFFFQADTVICARSNATVNDFLGLDKFETGYDWVGAQWHFRGYPQPPSGGNGGFSIRRRQAMLEVTRLFGGEWKGENEDMWFAEMLKRTSNQFPEQDLAMEFAFETPPAKALELEFVYKPYGVHIGNGGSWPLCQPPRERNDKYIRRLLEWCPEAKTVIPNGCIPPW